MRIDRRGNPALRKFPEAGEIKENIDLTGIAGTGPEVHADIPRHAGELTRVRASVPLDAFNALESGDHNFVGKVARVFAAVGDALRDIKQGSSKTFD